MQPLFVVDTFTDRPFAGNPAGIQHQDTERDPTWMQNVASELTLSETSFLRRQEENERRRCSAMNNYAEILRSLLMSLCRMIDTLRRP
jgi:hypothetical protein